MNGLAVMLCVSVLGVQQTWRTTQEGQLEYVLQVEPTFLASLEQGESVTSNLPATAKEVHRLCLRFSAADLKKAPQRNLELPPLATPQERATQAEPDIPAALIVDAEGRSEETTDVSHGWQATNDGRVKYVVQLSPDLLGKLRDGDEIYMNLYPEAGQIQQFIVVAGQNVLPRKGVRAPAPAALTAKNHKTVAPAAAETAETANVYGPTAEESSPAARRAAGARAAEAPVAESRPFEPRTGEPPRLRNPSRFSATDETTEQPIDQPLEQPLYGGVEDGQPGAAPELIRENPAEEMPREEPEPTRYGSINRPKTTPGSAPKTTHASLTPPDDGNQYLLDDEPRDPTPRRRFGAADNTVATTAGEEEQAEIDNNRIASIPSTGGKASLSAGKTKLPKNTSAVATSDPVPTTWGPWMLVCCALFLSIGGNLYLGWTAAEFYSRYRLTIERMRSGGRETDQD